MTDLIRVERGETATISLARPDRRNALSAEMLRALFDALGEIAADAACRAIVLRGDGDHFCAGADFGDVSASAAGGARYGSGFEQLLRTIEEHPLPVIARVRGAALGAGCQLLAACDLSVAATDARIGIPSARLGLLLDLEKIERMVRVIGLPHTRELLLTGHAIDGTRAASWGLVTHAVPLAELDAAVDALVAEIASAAPLSVRGSKSGLRALSSRAALSRERDVHLFAAHDAAAAEALESSDLQEGIRALREKRAPRFTGS